MLSHGGAAVPLCSHPCSNMQGEWGWAGRWSRRTEKSATQRQPV